MAWLSEEASTTSGKLQTGLTCHHKFNSDMIHSITTGIQKNIGDLLENVDKAMDKYNATYSIGSKSKSSVSRKKKENRKNPNIERKQHPNIESEGLV